MKNRVQGMVIGFLTATILLGSVAVAATYQETLTITRTDMKLVVDGVLFTPSDSSGKEIQPFIYNGTTYLPLSSIAKALGKTAEWDSATNTGYIGGKVDKILKEIPLYNRPYLDIGNSNGFEASGNNIMNAIKIYDGSKDTDLGNGRYYYSNYVVYPLNAVATRFKAVLNPPHDAYNPELTYRVYGDEKLLFTSPILRPSTAPQLIDIDVSNILQLKIEVELTSSSPWRTLLVSYSYGAWGFTHQDYKGIENAVIVTSDY